jgi:F-type H+-transporting ATPase subunit b
MITKFGIKIGLILWVALAAFLFIFGSGKEAADPHSINLWEIAQKSFNILLLLDIILYFTGGNLKNFFKNRERTIKSEMETAAESSKELSARLSETKERVDKLAAEIENIIQKARKEADEEKQAIIQKARKEAQRTVELTKREIELEYSLASKKLKALIASLAIERTEEILRKTLKPEDAKDLIDKSIAQLEQVKK